MGYCRDMNHEIILQGMSNKKSPASKNSLCIMALGMSVLSTGVQPPTPESHCCYHGLDQRYGNQWRSIYCHQSCGAMLGWTVWRSAGCRYLSEYSLSFLFTLRPMHSHEYINIYERTYTHPKTAETEGWAFTLIAEVWPMCEVCESGARGVMCSC